MMSSHVANVVMISTCCKRWFNAQEKMLALSGTQRHVARRTIVHKYATETWHVLWFAQAKLPASATYSRDGVICIWSRAI